MKDYIDKHNLLYSSQYGFHKGHSTQHAILNIVNAIQSNMNQGLFSCGVFIDLEKAFDTVDHNILLDKLNHYGFRGIGPCISNKANVSCGIPQRSVLGPLLFLLYVNELHRCSNKRKFYLFAGDTNILYADKNLKSLENIVNIELRNLHEWLTAIKLTLNPTKTNFVIFHPYQKRVTYQLSLYMFDNEKNGNETRSRVKKLYQISWCVG